MTNRVAIALVIIIAGALIYDFSLNGGSASFFLAKKFLDLVDWVAFWR